MSVTVDMCNANDEVANDGVATFLDGENRAGPLQKAWVKWSEAVSNRPTAINQQPLHGHTYEKAAAVATQTARADAVNFILGVRVCVGV